MKFRYLHATAKQTTATMVALVISVLGIVFIAGPTTDSGTMPPADWPKPDCTDPQDETRVDYYKTDSYPSSTNFNSATAGARIEWNESGAKIELYPRGNSGYFSPSPRNYMNELGYGYVPESERDVGGFVECRPYRGTLEECDIQMHDGFNFGFGSSIRSSEVDYESTLLHEFGHMLGLSDKTSCFGSSKAVMCPTLAAGNIRRELESDDEEALRGKYCESGTADDPGGCTQSAVPTISSVPVSAREDFLAMFANHPDLNLTEAKARNLYETHYEELENALMEHEPAQDAVNSYIADNYDFIQSQSTSDPQEFDETVATDTEETFDTVAESPTLQTAVNSGEPISIRDRLEGMADAFKDAEGMTLDQVATSYQTKAPESFELKGNYPNPARTSTTIEYGLPQSSHVTVEVFDMTGRKVRTLVNETKGTRTHRVKLSVSDLSSGVYVYRIEADELGTQTGKLTVVK